MNEKEELKKCGWYPRICNFQTGHSYKYCGCVENCEHKKEKKAPKKKTKRTDFIFID